MWAVYRKHDFDTYLVLPIVQFNVGMAYSINGRHMGINVLQ